MTRMIVVLAAAILLAACASEGQGKGNSADIRRQAKEAIQNPVPAPAPSEESQNFLDNIQMTMPNASIFAGATECVDIKVGAFKDILAMQYTLQWDKNVLTFAGLKEFKLPFMSNENFGSTLAPNGQLTAVWIDNSLKGVSIANGSTMYQICFKATGKAGQSSDLTVTSQPTAIEVVTVGDQVWGIESNKGKITIK